MNSNSEGERMDTVEESEDPQQDTRTIVGSDENHENNTAVDINQEVALSQPVSDFAEEDMTSTVTAWGLQQHSFLGDDCPGLAECRPLFLFDGNGGILRSQTDCFRVTRDKLRGTLQEALELVKEDQHLIYCDEHLQRVITTQK